MEQYKVKYKTVKIKNCAIRCHDKAKQAFDESLILNYQYKNKSQNSFMDIVSVIEPLHVILDSKDCYTFFSGWYWFSQLNKYEDRKVSLLVYTASHYEEPGISREEIEMFSWAYMLSQNMKQLGSTTYLANFKNLVNKVPSKYINKLLNKEYLSSSNKFQMEKFCGKPRTSIANQQKKLPKIISNPKTPLDSIF